MCVLSHNSRSIHVYKSDCVCVCICAGLINSVSCLIDRVLILVYSHIYVPANSANETIITK